MTANNLCKDLSHIHTHTRTTHTHAHTHTRLMALFPGLPGWAGTRNVKPIWILLKPETVSCSGISWDICKFALRSRPAPHHSVFYRPDALPAAQPTASKHWSQQWTQLSLFVSTDIIYCFTSVNKAEHRDHNLLPCPTSCIINSKWKTAKHV